MKTFQDLEKVLSSTDETGKFIISAIDEHKASELYQTAKDAEEYMKMRNVTISKYQKLLYTLSGKAVPDNWSANHKLYSNFFNRFITQETQYLLGNGVTFNEETTKEKLGGDMFDKKIQELGKYALIGAVSFGFFNQNHIDAFKVTEFVPLWDEEDGSLKAGIRFWQIDSEKPLRATLYELDGYTDFIKRKNDVISILNKKRAYQQIVTTSIIDGTTIKDGDNYPNFPIVPFWGNPQHQSELVGIRSQIDAYDLIKSGFCNDFDDCSQIFWIIKNAGGMDDIDLAKFIQRIKTTRTAPIDDDADVDAHTMDIPYQSREAFLSRLENDMYNDAMALNVNQIAAGNVTATAIQAAYEPLNNKVDQFEYCVMDFIKGILDLIDINDSPTFKRSKISNMTEETNMILASAQYLDDETILKHLPFISPDEVESILDKRVKEESSRFVSVNNDNIDNDDIDKTITERTKND